MTTLSDSRDDSITELHTTATLAFTEVALFKRTAWRLGHGHSSKLDGRDTRLYGTSTLSKIFCTTVSAVTSSASAS